MKYSTALFVVTVAVAIWATSEAASTKDAAKAQAQIVQTAAKIVNAAVQGDASAVKKNVQQLQKVVNNQATTTKKCGKTCSDDKKKKNEAAVKKAVDSQRLGSLKTSRGVLTVDKSVKSGIYQVQTSTKASDIKIDNSKGKKATIVSLKSGTYVIVKDKK